MTDHNPYSPPVAQVADTAEPARKPIAVWLLQLIAAIIVVVGALGIMRGLWFVQQVNEHKRININGPTVSWFLQHFAIVAFAAASIFVVQRRSIFGRWFAFVSVLALVSAVTWNSPQFPQPSERYRADLFQYFSGAALVYGPLLLLIFFCAFSRKARAYYSHPPAAQS